MEMIKKPRIRGLVLFEVFVFCLKASFQSSKKYFIIRVLLNFALLSFPFILVNLNRTVMDLLVVNITASVEHTADMEPFILTCLLIFGVSVANKVFSDCMAYCEGMHRDLLAKYTQSEIILKAADMDLSYFDSTAFYNELSDASGSIYLINNTTFQSIAFVRSLIQLCIAFFYLSGYNALYAVLILLASVPSIVFQKKMLGNIYSWQRDSLGHERKLFYLTNMTTMKHFAKDAKFYNLGGYLKAKYQDLWLRWFLQKKKISYKSTILLTFSSVLPEIATAYVSFQIIVGVLQKHYTVGDYTYYQGIIVQLLGSLYMVINIYSGMGDSKARIQNYKKFLRWENRTAKIGGLDFDSADSFVIEFKGVSFAYADDLPKVLDCLSMTISSSQRTALVGINGSGKSTIIKLILRFYDPTEGSILLNGLDIRKYNIKDVRKLFSVMFQDYCNYAFSVAESVSLSDTETSPRCDDIEDSLRKSGANSFVKEFDRGIETFLTREYEESGQELSGGQWQKIALARTFYRDASVYILDEPSSSLDAESEDELFANYEKLYQNKGAILISHRLSNITSVDNIIVIDGGKAMEQGTHRELMKCQGIYARLFRLQADKYTEYGDDSDA